VFLCGTFGSVSMNVNVRYLMTYLNEFEPYKCCLNMRFFCGTFGNVNISVNGTWTATYFKNDFVLKEQLVGLR